MSKRFTGRPSPGGRPPRPGRSSSKTRSASADRPRGRAGEPGNSAIAGSRLANGGPFRELNELEPGDRIEVTSPLGRFEYRVTKVRRIATGDPDPARATGEGNQLTLLTSAPMFLATERLAVVADQPCAIHSQHDRQLLQADVVQDLIVAAL